MHVSGKLQISNSELKDALIADEIGLFPVYIV